MTFRFLDWPGHSVVVEGQFSEFVFTVDQVQHSSCDAVLSIS